ncbi:uncharacterized protein LOC125453788 [Stegostoma tigrinum]|uniref:uncharacterized protein LOC125453788 n=1 Tax=Stegostoma tigrinum TaxID=3053191 RepID=UPI00202B2922|nr:uncharacterized protein LOC125453788 [Stegostoma tigrinum]
MEYTTDVNCSNGELNVGVGNLSYRCRSPYLAMAWTIGQPASLTFFTGRSHVLFAADDATAAPITGRSFTATASMLEGAMLLLLLGSLHLITRTAGRLLPLRKRPTLAANVMLLLSSIAERIQIGTVNTEHCHTALTANIVLPSPPITEAPGRPLPLIQLPPQTTRTLPLFCTWPTLSLCRLLLNCCKRLKEKRKRKQNKSWEWMSPRISPATLPPC